MEEPQAQYVDTVLSNQVLGGLFHGQCTIQDIQMLEECKELLINQITSPVAALIQF